MMKFRDLLPSVVNLVNSSIGVGMLAMPYCFHQCGIILALVVLVFSGFFTIFASESVLRAGLFFHCSSFEDSAYKSHGIFGKRLVGLSLIGLLFGMLVGFNVSISDMGSDVLATVFETKPTIFYRRLFLIATLCVVLPLCLLRRVELISWASSVAVLIYLIFLTHLVFACGLPKLFTGNPLRHVRWWRLDGLVHCLPVIASSLCCQVQVHVIYNSLRDQTHGNMRKALTYAVTFVISAYALAGLFGYLAFIEVEEEDSGEGGTLAGNMLTMYPENFVSALVRLGFLYTVTASFPLMLFPLRSALNSLLFEETAGDSGPISSVKELPLMRFRLMTLLVILLSIVVSQCTDKVEVILSCTGSLAGALICYILPACVYLRTLGASSPNRLLALLLLAYGLTVLITPLFTFIGVDSPLPLDAAPSDDVGPQPQVPDPAVQHRLLQILPRPGLATLPAHPPASRNVSSPLQMPQ